MTESYTIRNTDHLARPVLAALKAAGIEVGQPAAGNWLGASTQPATIYTLPITHRADDGAFDRSQVNKSHMLTVSPSGRFHTTLPVPGLADNHIGMTNDRDHVTALVRAVSGRHQQCALA